MPEKKCNGCADIAMIPLAAHEAAMDRAERHSKRWMIAFIIATISLFASNLAWFAHIS